MMYTKSIHIYRVLRSKVDVYILVNVHASLNESIRNFCKGQFNILPMSVHSRSCSI